MTQKSMLGLKQGTSTRDFVPKVVIIGLYAILAVAGIAGVLNPGRSGPFPTAPMLDVWLGLMLLVSLARGILRIPGTLLLVVGYGVTRLMPALVTESPLTDFLQAYRWLFYLFVFAAAVGRTWTPIKGLIQVTWLLVGLALINAVVTLWTEASDRPGLLIENNFEIALFCGLAIVVFPHLKRHKITLVIALGALTLLMQSRSGAVVFAIFFIYAVLHTPTKHIFIKYILILTIPLAGFLVVDIFEERTGTRIDRVDFLRVFLAETQDWSLVQWLFGTTPLTPLSQGACHSLNFYSQLFSSVGDGRCYSVILHSFILRVTFDAGLLGLFLAFGLTWHIMRRAGVRNSVALALTAVSLANSASVSGPNNPYVALPILLAIVTATKVWEDVETPSQTFMKPIRV